MLISITTKTVIIIIIVKLNFISLKMLNYFKNLQNPSYHYNEEVVIAVILIIAIIIVVVITFIIRFALK